MKIILIHPPQVKPSEPPVGIARLSACLRANNVEHTIIDANLEGILYLLRQTGQTEQTGRWDRRACRNVSQNLAAIKNIHIYSNIDKYSRAVSDTNRVLDLSGQPFGTHLTLADFTHSRLSAVRSNDLFYAALHPEENPYYPYFQKRLSEALSDSPGYIGFSLNYLSQALCAFAMIGFIRKTAPGQKILLGGSLATSWIRITGRNDWFKGLIDEVVCGPGEDRLLELAGVKERSLSPSVDYALFTPNAYLSPGFALPYSVARGCWWRRCAFCPESAEANPYRTISSGQVTTELQNLATLCRPSLFHFVDSSLAPALLGALINRPPGVPWYGFARVTRHLTDLDFCRALKESGCVMLQLGIESGDQHVLDNLNKGIDLKDVAVALSNLHAAGIAVYGYFLFGTPPENEVSALRTLDFVIKNSEYLTYLNLAIFNLPALSPDARTLASGDFYEGDLSLYRTFRHPQDWQRQNVRIFLDKTVKRHPAVAAILRRTPAFFTSNHAPFFHVAK